MIYKAKGTDFKKETDASTHLIYFIKGKTAELKAAETNEICNVSIRVTADSLLPKIS